MSRPGVLAAGHAVTKAPETNIARMIAGKIRLGVFFIRSSLFWFHKCGTCLCKNVAHPFLCFFRPYGARSCTGLYPCFTPRAGALGYMSGADSRFHVIPIFFGWVD